MIALAVILIVAMGAGLILLASRLQQSETARRSVESERDKTRDELAKVQHGAIARLQELEKELAGEREAVRAEGERTRAHFEEQLGAELQRLEPLRRYSAVADAEAEARRILGEAVDLAQRLRSESQAASQRELKKIEADLADAVARVANLRSESDVILSNANQKAHDVVDQAHKNAEAIGGDAYRALREHDRLEAALKAIRNLIDGYGDRYVVPTRSVVDDLASDYSHTEAGEKLRQAREHTQRMVQEGHAAACDYAEARRQETAMRFVLDAFNGHVDAILARARHDNVGTLSQEVRDEFALVNLNGEAFRNARILPAYLDARLAELTWAVATMELRQRERDEQRRIQEQIREEEKARREIERALKDHARQETAIREALEADRARLGDVAAKDRAKLEAHIAELSQQLLEAETRNQRAMSMAQQTRAGVVYIISNVGSFGDDVIKIGMTRRMDPQDRIRELGDASVPFVFDVHAMIQTDDAPALERELHDRFDDRRINRVNYRKEFFRIPVADLKGFVAEKGLSASFTLVAEAREYRESMALKSRPGQAARERSENGQDEDDGGDGL